MPEYRYVRTKNKKWDLIQDAEVALDPAKADEEAAAILLFLIRNVHLATLRALFVRLRNLSRADRALFVDPDGEARYEDAQESAQPGAPLATTGWRDPGAAADHAERTAGVAHHD